MGRIQGMDMLCGNGWRKAGGTTAFPWALIEPCTCVAPPVMFQAQHAGCYRLWHLRWVEAPGGGPRIDCPVYSRIATRLALACPVPAFVMKHCPPPSALRRRNRAAMCAGSFWISVGVYGVIRTSGVFFLGESTHSRHGMQSTSACRAPTKIRSAPACAAPAVRLSAHDTPPRSPRPSRSPSLPQTRPRAWRH